MSKTGSHTKPQPPATATTAATKTASTTAAGSRRFDTQATAYDRRAGLPPGMAAQVAERVRQLAAQAQTNTPDEPAPSLLEIAAGTGELGAELCRHFTYIALEGSVPMLEQFQHRLAQAPPLRPSPRLIHSDANRPWPVAPTSQTVVFIARAAHLIDAAHLARELRRCSQPHGVLILGRVVKSRDSMAARLRQLLHGVLHEHGYRPARGGQVQQVLARLLGHEPHSYTAARWQVNECATDILRQWRDKPGLGGVMMSAGEQSTMLAQLQNQAREHFPDLEQAQPGTREYQLTLIPIHP